MSSGLMSPGLRDTLSGIKCRQSKTERAAVVITPRAVLCRVLRRGFSPVFSVFFFRPLIQWGKWGFIYCAGLALQDAVDGLIDDLAVRPASHTGHNGAHQTALVAHSDSAQFRCYLPGNPLDLRLVKLLW